MKQFRTSNHHQTQVEPHSTRRSTISTISLNQPAKQAASPTRNTMKQSSTRSTLPITKRKDTSKSKPTSRSLPPKVIIRSRRLNITKKDISRLKRSILAINR